MAQVKQTLILHLVVRLDLGLLSDPRQCSSRFTASSHYLPIHPRCVSSTQSRRVWRHVLRTCDLGDHGAWFDHVLLPDEEHQSSASFYWTHWLELSAHEHDSSLLSQIQSAVFRCFSTTQLLLSVSVSGEYRLHGFDTRSSIDSHGPDLRVSTAPLLHSTVFRFPVK